MKKISALILAVVLVFTAAVCPSFAADTPLQKNIKLPNEIVRYRQACVSDNGTVAALVTAEGWGHEVDAIAYSKDNINYSLFMLDDYATAYDYCANLECRGNEFLIAVYSQKEVFKNGISAGFEVSAKLLSTKDFKTVKSYDCPKTTVVPEAVRRYNLGGGLMKMNNGDVILSLPGYVKTKTEKHSEEADNIYGYGIYYVTDKNCKLTERHSPEVLMSSYSSDYYIKYTAMGDLLEVDVYPLIMGGDFDGHPYIGYCTSDYKNYTEYTADNEAYGLELLAANKDSAYVYVYSRNYSDGEDSHTAEHILSAVDKTTGAGKTLRSYTYDCTENYPQWYCLNNCDGYDYCFMQDESFNNIVNRINMKTGGVKKFKLDVDVRNIEKAVYSNGFIVLNTRNWTDDGDTPDLGVTVISAEDFKTVNKYTVPFSLSDMYINGNKAYRINDTEAVADIITLPFEDPVKFNGLIKTDAGWQYFKNGKVDNDFAGLAKNDYGWWFVSNGTIDYEYEGLAENQYGLWYVKNGKIDFNRNTVTRYNGEWYYVENGKVDTKKSGLLKTESGWMYFKNGKVDAGFEGLAKNQYGWWYVLNGKIDYRYQGLAKNQYGWWYVSNGTIDYKYQGLAKNQYGWWYVSNGKIDYNFEGLAKNQYGWWYVSDGKIDYSFKGLAKNDYGWWYIKNGKIDFTYNGTARNPYGRWNVVNGKVTTRAY